MKRGSKKVEPLFPRTTFEAAADLSEASLESALVAVRDFKETATIKSEKRFIQAEAYKFMQELNKRHTTNKIELDSLDKPAFM